MRLLMQLKFSSVKVSSKIRSSLITLLLIFFSLFSINSCYAVAVGDSYGGGTVFCVSKTADITTCVPEGTGDYGLIMANEDQVNFDSNPQHGVTWSSAYKAIGVSAQSLDDGATNTAAILAAHLGDNSGNNAAHLCRSYKDPIEGHTDWYLPSKNELNKMYVYAKAHNLIGKGCSGDRANGVVRCLVGGYDDPNKIYWSSSECSGSAYGYAWGRSFSSGNQGGNDKVGNHFAVRAIRAFNDLAIQQFNHLLLGLNQTQIIQEIAKNNPYMVSVNLSAQGIADGHTRQLAEALKTNNVIRHIDLRNNGLIDESFNILIDIVEAHPSLKSVDISGVNSLSHGVKERLQKVLEAKSKL